MNTSHHIVSDNGSIRKLVQFLADPTTDQLSGSHCTRLHDYVS